MLHKSWEIKDKNYSGKNTRTQKHQKPEPQPQKVTTDDPLENGDIF